ncbi:DUF2637 domain-containing protein [Pseudonocardia sp. RS010]|uniref:DUF2637 domain-containing protein n=1 Tax=Pseudonocardia sp. RS010 TaxID=3385979 RepID=UPI0039A3067C
MRSLVRHRKVQAAAEVAVGDTPRSRWNWQKAVGGGRGLLLGVVVLAPEAAAWQGLLALARDTFHMDGHLAYLVPLLFGAAAFYVALLAQRYVLRGDSAMTERVLTWLYAAAGAGFNFWHADHVQHEPAAALFFGGASLSAALLWDRTLRAWRRDQLREIGALERPLPRFRALRWVLAPAETFRAFRLSVMRGLSTPDEALALVEAEAERKRAGTSQSAAQAVEQTGAAPADRPAGELPGPVAHLEETVPAAEQGDAETVETVAATGSVEVETEPQGIEAIPDQQRRTSLSELAQHSKAGAVREAWRMIGVAEDETPTREHIDRAVELLGREGVEVTPKYAREVRRRVELGRTEQPARTLRAVGS